MAEPVPGTGTGFSGVDQLVSRVCPTRCLGNWWGRGMKISPAFGLGFGFGFWGSSAKPRERSLWAMRWIAEFGRAWVSEVELRMRKRVLGSGGCEGKKVKGKGDWSVTVRGFEGSEEGCM